MQLTGRVVLRTIGARPTNEVLKVSQLQHFMNANMVLTCVDAVALEAISRANEPLGSRSFVDR